MQCSIVMVPLILPTISFAYGLTHFTSANTSNVENIWCGHYVDTIYLPLAFSRKPTDASFATHESNIDNIENKDQPAIRIPPVILLNNRTRWSKIAFKMIYFSNWFIIYIRLRLSHPLEYRQIILELDRLNGEHSSH